MHDLFDQYDLFYERSFLVDSIRQYILSVVCIAVLCALIQMLLAGGSMESLVKLVTGLTITLIVLNPVLNIGLIRIDTYFDDLAADAALITEEGEGAATDMVSKHIKERTEAYICDMANELGVKVSVDVRVIEGNPPAPAEITVTGTVAPYVKTRLSDIIEKDLGISEDDQIWIS